MAIDENNPSTDKRLAQYEENNAVKISGAVSPAARATASTTPVAMGVKAVGTVIRVIVMNREAPTPNAPRRRSSGTNFNPSSVVLMMVGIIKIESARPPATAL